MTILLYSYLSIYILLCFIVWIIFIRYKRDKSVYIVVLGDIGRSPRMQHHAISFAKEKYKVYIFGYNDSNTIDEVRHNNLIKIVNIPKVPILFNRLPVILKLMIRIIWQSIILFIYLLKQGKASYILLQNPPSIPAMIICYIVSRLCKSNFIIDWHNYGYTLLRLKLGHDSIMVKLYYTYERLCGRLSDFNICVTKAMSKDLKVNWNIKAIVLYDKPLERFRSLDINERHIFFNSLDVFKSGFADSYYNYCYEGSTIFTHKTRSGKIEYNLNRPALLVSSTSWTEDEDFMILLNALQKYDYICTNDMNLKLPQIVCIITGKGIQKEFYMEKIKQLKLINVTIHTLWLESDNYPKLLGSADLGICLHISSSGLDLPMKVIDMFGCNLPVCAIKYNCIHELIGDNKNGILFNNEDELVEKLKKLLTGFPNNCKNLDILRSNLRSFTNIKRHTYWRRTFYYKLHHKSCRFNDNVTYHTY